MSPDPKTPQDSQPTQEAKSASQPRRKYEAPRLKRLGSVRDLTLGSPALPFGDSMGGRQRAPM